MISQFTIHRGRASVCVLTSAAAIAVAACSDSTGPSTRTPAAIAAVSGAGQSGLIGSTLASPVVFEVTTAADVPVSGVTVTFAVTTGTATLTPTTAVTDANGAASTQVTLGASAGSVEITATVQGASLVARVTATATTIASSDCTSSSTTLTLGQVVVGIAGTLLCVRGGTAGGDFTLVPFNSTLDGTSRASVTFQASGVGATAVASLTPATATFNLLAGTSLAAASKPPRSLA